MNDFLLLETAGQKHAEGGPLDLEVLEGAHERGVSGVSSDSRILSIGGNHGKGDG